MAGVWTYVTTVSKPKLYFALSEIVYYLNVFSCNLHKFMFTFSKPALKANACVYSYGFGHDQESYKNSKKL